jgi:hypothetical protein
MSITVANTANTNTWEYFINRVNELAYHTSGAVLTSDSTGNNNVTSGNAVLSGTFTANVVSVGNSSVNVAIIPANSTIQNAGKYYLNANGSWVETGGSKITTAVSSTGWTLIDSFSAADYSAADYVIAVNDSSNSKVMATKITLVQDGSGVYSTEYATIGSNTTFVVFNANISAGTVRLYVNTAVTPLTVKTTRLTV